MLVQNFHPRLFISTATNTQSNGAVANIYLRQPIELPSDARNVTISVTSATFWYNFPNITGKSWYLYLDGIEHRAVIPDGLYGLAELGAQLSRVLTNLGLDPERITIGGDDSTQKILFQFNSGLLTDAIRFNATDSLYDLLGVPYGTTVAPTVVPGVVSATKVAAFNTVNSVIIQSDLVQGIPKNGDFDGTIAQIPLTVFPGSQQTFQPSVPIQIPANGLVGRTISDVQFRLCNEQGVLLNTLGESFSVGLLITYYTRV